MRVDNLQAETTITEQGERVYSPNNKPSASDIGALPTAGKAANSAKADLAMEALYLTAKDDRDVKPATSNTGKNKKTVKPFFVGNSVFPANNRPFGTYSDLLLMDTYSDASGGRVNGIVACKSSNALFHVQGEQDGEWTTSEKVYTTAQKPTAAEVGAHPNSWRPTWNDVSSKPAQATRWPKWGEISDKPGTMPPDSHTHPWSQITGIPSYATRWPKWGEISGKPGNLLTQTTADTRYLGKTAKATNSDKLDGYNSSDFQRIVGKSVSASGGKWYTIAVGESRCNAEFIVTDTNGGQHGYVRFQAGISYGNYPYINILASNAYANANGIIRYLRIVDKDSDRTYGKKELQVYIDTSGTFQSYINLWFTAHNGWNLVNPTVASGTNTERVKIDVDKTTGFHSSADMFVGTHKVYHQGHKPTAADVGAMTQSQGDGRYTRFNYGGTTSFASLTPPKSSWIRSPTSGFLPYSTGTSSLGTSTWKWKDVHGINIYQNGQRVYSPTNKPSAATIGAEPKLATDRKRKITYGTGNPTGGADGDVYIQYK